MDNFAIMYSFTADPRVRGGAKGPPYSWILCETIYKDRIIHFSLQRERYA